MGFFSKIKQNLNHGGVSISMQAPAIVSTTDATIPVAVTVTAGESPQIIKSITAEVMVTVNDRDFQQRNASENVAHRETYAENTEEFTLQPGESKIAQLQIPMPAHEGGPIALASKLQGLQVTFGSKSHYTYEIQASADVKGIALDPADSAPLQIVK